VAAELAANLRGEVRFDAGSRALYAKDSVYRHVPIGVVIPRDIDDVVATVELRRRRADSGPRLRHQPQRAVLQRGWEDAAVPPERLGEYLRDFDRLLGRFGYRCVCYGHFGLGCVHTRSTSTSRRRAA
jgi:FAD/FMN-containing dehydrogenase